MINNILNYWYRTEYFTPCWPVNTEKDTDLNKNEIPWFKNSSDHDTKLSYDLYFGTIKTINLINWMLSAIGAMEEESVEPDNSITCMFAFKVDEMGYYIPSSFSVSSLVWAVCQIVSVGSISAELKFEDLECFQRDFDSLIMRYQEEIKCPLDRIALNYIFDVVCNTLGISNKIAGFALWVRTLKLERKKDGSFPNIQPTTELMQSYYLDDIKKILDNPTEKINRYVMSGQITDDSKNINSRKFIDSDIECMKKWVEIDKYPLGVWPSEYNPSLMQQIGINICTSGAIETFSINGPPGTGKTTLLKEIVVSNVIERARILAEFENPDEAFNSVEFNNPCDQDHLEFYCMDDRLKEFGIIVASNNNAAVENISLDLPKLIPKDRCGMFSKESEEVYEDIYFTDVASKLIGQRAWGLVSAKLGKKDNLNRLKERLWWANDQITLRRHYKCRKASSLDWSKARNDFEQALNNVLNERKYILYAQSLINKKAEYISRLSTVSGECNHIEELLRERQTDFDYETSMLQKLTTKLESIDERIKFLYSNMNLFQKMFCKLIKSNKVINEWRLLSLEKQEMILRISKQKNICYEISENVTIIEKELFNCNRKAKSIKDAIEAIEKEIVSVKRRVDGKWADDKYWENIIGNVDSQVNSPWVYEKYNELREELFYQALQLNKAFVLSSVCVRKNLENLFNLWDGKHKKVDRINSYGEVLNTLLLVIPVVSTTFASVERFLSDVGPEELGLLVIDEAGQATPQSALGALWRTRKAIVVGDPLQVEPVSTIPKELAKRFADEFNIPPYYRVPEISVQLLADRINEYGGYRNVNGNKVWLGCPLVVHRRCIDPMFSVSNKVAYDERMILQTRPPKDSDTFVFEHSIWFDVRGKENGNKDHTVQNQVEFTKQLFIKSIEICQGFPDLFIITPFKRVAENLRTMMISVLKSFQFVDQGKVSIWVKEHCGTIHTFQGKEAKEVILVLGCDSQSGKSAAQWVGQKPNIINVAVSRAKFRIAVVGDFDLWKNIPNVQVLCRFLKRDK